MVVVRRSCWMVFGLNAARKLSVDAFPDVTNVQVQIATEAKGRSSEEYRPPVPLEISMTGLPGFEEMRSLNIRPVADQSGVHRCDGCVLRPSAGDWSGCSKWAPDGHRAGARSGVHRLREVKSIHLDHP